NEQLEELQNEISDLREVLNLLNSMISTKSFQSADIIYSKSMQEVDKKQDDTQYFVNDISSDRVKDTNIKRKIFSEADEKDSKLLGILNFLDLNKVHIKLIDPMDRKIRETSEAFIRTFLKEALLKIKDTNPDLALNYEYFKNSDVIECIIITNLKSIEEFDLITSKMRELLTKQITS
ncbi:MAG: hypothetical protein KAX18_14410, partial [Candidatus Lokiarchaeota archaeon]|nr:hypothetical protein [Candidatus Lokiarchaeota archaeon]